MKKMSGLRATSPFLLLIIKWVVKYAYVLLKAVCDDRSLYSLLKAAR